MCYRPISLLNTLYKLFAAVVASRLQAWANKVLRNTQYGFRGARSTGDPLHLVRRAQDLAEEREYQTLHLIFLDWEKAFDSVDRGRMLADFRGAGLGESSVALLSALLLDPSFRVRMNQDLSEWKSQERGVRQGCTLSPLLFIIQLSIVMDQVEGKVRNAYPLGLTPIFSFPVIEYADDTVIISKVSHVATEALQLLQREAAQRGLFLNLEKTKELALNTEER
eukprot:15463193-Alexandrium_andersonii.AAC.1